MIRHALLFEVHEISRTASAIAEAVSLAVCRRA